MFINKINIKENKIVIVFIVIVCILFVNLAMIIRGQNHTILPENLCVQTKEDAIIIGKTICERVYPEYEYEKYMWECIDCETYWNVFCTHINNSPDTVTIGGLPEIHIKKDNAEVIFISKMA